MSDVERRTYTVTADGPVGSTEAAKALARADGWTVKTLVSCRAVAGDSGSWVVTLAVIHKAAAAAAS